MMRSINFSGRGQFLNDRETIAVTAYVPRVVVQLLSEFIGFRTKVHHAEGIKFRETDYWNQPLDPDDEIGYWVGPHMKTFSELTMRSPFKKHYVIEQTWSYHRAGILNAKVILPGEPAVLRELGYALLSEADELEKEGFLTDEAASLSDSEEFGFRKIWREE